MPNCAAIGIVAVALINAASPVPARAQGSIATSVDKSPVLPGGSLPAEILGLRCRKDDSYSSQPDYELVAVCGMHVASWSAAFGADPRPRVRIMVAKVARDPTSAELKSMMTAGQMTLFDAVKNKQPKMRGTVLFDVLSQQGDQGWKGYLKSETGKQLVWISSNELRVTKVVAGPYLSNEQFRTASAAIESRIFGNSDPAQSPPKGN